MKIAKPRGNRKSRAEIANRHKEVVEFLAQGLSAEEIATMTGASRRTIFRDLDVLNEQVAELPVTLEKFTAYRERQRQELERLKRVVIGSPDFNDRDRVAALLKINESLTALLCLDSEKLIEKTMPGSSSGTVILELRPVNPPLEPVRDINDAPLVMKPELPIGKQVPQLTDNSVTLNADAFDADDPAYKTDEELIAEYDRTHPRD